MKIESIQIKNVRGISDKTISLNMIPNKPSVLVAPNGTGKSSLALAFERLNKNRINLNDGDYYQNVEINKPEIIIKVDNVEYKATDNRNDIGKEFAVFVINSKHKPHTIRHNIGGQNIATTKMSVDPIVLAKVVPNDQLTYDFVVDNHLNGFQKGVIVKIDALLENKSFMLDLDLDYIKNKHRLKAIDSFIIAVRNYIGTGNRGEIYNNIKVNDLDSLRKIPSVQRLVEKLRAIPDYAEKHETRLFLDAIQLIFVYNNDKKAFENKIKRYQYLELKDRYTTLFNSLKGTWKNIHPKEVGDELMVEIDNSDQLSNGERDIIVFLAMLEKAKMKLNKNNNILIIDEIFDYLDDANFISAQYYITKYIDEYKEENKKIRIHNDSLPADQQRIPEKNFFPIILTHLDPVTFKQFGYKDLKVYYFDDLTHAHVSENMKHLIHKRDKLEKEDKANGTEIDKISKYLLHYHHDTPDDVSGVLPEQCVEQWKNPINFKNYCKSQSEKYINNEPEFDPFAVCVWLRECIEKYLFDKLTTDVQRGNFYKKEQNGTKNKLNYAKECGVDYPETFSLLGLIYNSSLHLGSGGDIRSDVALVSKLKNNTIKAMIKSVMDTYVI